MKITNFLSRLCCNKSYDDNVSTSSYSSDDSFWALQPQLIHVDIDATGTQEIAVPKKEKNNIIIMNKTIDKYYHAHKAKEFPLDSDSNKERVLDYPDAKKIRSNIDESTNI